MRRHLRAGTTLAYTTADVMQVAAEVWAFSEVPSEIEAAQAAVERLARSGHAGNALHRDIVARWRRGEYSLTDVRGDRVQFHGFRNGGPVRVTVRVR